MQPAPRWNQGQDISPKTNPPCKGPLCWRQRSGLPAAGNHAEIFCIGTPDGTSDRIVPR